MPQAVVCPMCGKKLRVPDQKIGKRAKCPGCDKTIALLPHIQIESPEEALELQSEIAPQDAPKPETKSAIRLMHVWVIVLILIASFSAMWTIVAYWALPSWFYASGWLSIISFTICAATLLRLRFKVRKSVFGIGLLVLTILFLWLYSSTGTYETSWNGTQNGEDVTITDTYHRSGNDRIIYRRIVCPDPDPESLLPKYTIEGPIAGTEKRHGHWKGFSWNAPLNEMSQDYFYWYGESISEGEWYLRNQSK